MTPRRVAVVGAGPAGLYFTQRLLRRLDNSVHVDIFERRPTPFGLIRYGVAPDHPEVKACTKSLSKVFEEKNVRLFCKTPVHFKTRSEDLPIKLLESSYDAIVICVGAEIPRTLPELMKGPEKERIFTSSQMVAWINSDYVDKETETRIQRLGSARNIAIIGAGNVSLDVARILIKASNNDHIDMDPNVYSCLKNEHLKTVTIIARKEPELASFTTAELRDLFNTCQRLNVGISSTLDVLEKLGDISDDIEPRILRRLKLMQKHLQPMSTSKSVNFIFNESPVKYFDSKLYLNRQAVDADAVITCIGYEKNPDHVYESPKVFYAGWAKYGARGALVDTMQDAFEVAESVTAYLKEFSTSKDLIELPRSVLDKQVKF